jgi:alanine racemase
MTNAAAHAGAILTIDLDAVAANWRLLRDRLGRAECAAVLKADAYGLGLAPVARRLAREGCRSFFVAQSGEALNLRALLPEADIYVLNGLAHGAEADYAAHNLRPVLNTLDEIARWRIACRAAGAALPAVLNIDTGMARLGLAPDEVDALADEPDGLDGIRVVYTMSHMACAYARANPMNESQRRLFDAARSRLPPCSASFANSPGIFLGPEYHYDLARPGAALFGLQPQSGEPNPMAQVVRLQGKILQLRRVDRGMTVGYGATHRFAEPRLLATVAVGYGDGYFRTLGNRGSGFIGDIRVPVVGRISMDLVTFDVTDAPGREVVPGATIDIVGPRHDIDALAAEAGTIGYEVLTALGSRYHRAYLGADR